MDDHWAEVKKALQNAAGQVEAARDARDESVSLPQQVAPPRWNEQPDLVEELAFNGKNKESKGDVECPRPDAEKVLRQRLSVDRNE